MRPLHIVSALAFGCALAASLPVQARPKVAYTVVPLGAGSGSYATAINQYGQIAGRLIPARGGYRAFLYSAGALTELAALPGDTDSLAAGINQRGEVVGSSFALMKPSRAFLYSGSTMRDLGSLPGGGVTMAKDINDAGHIVGSSVLQDHFPFAFLYRDGLMLNLGAFPGTDRSTAAAINNRGQVAGTSGVGPSQGPNGNQTHAFLWQDGVMRDLGTLGGLNSMGEDVNEHGQVVGSATRAGGDGDEPDWRGFLWSHGRMRDLGAPPGGRMIQPLAINNRGQVVGMYAGYNRQRGFLYQRKGKIVDLNALIDPAQGKFVTIAYDINDAGQIVGEACDFAFTICTAVRLDPLPKGGQGDDQE
jgi:probable HAF family extracellular repeat protein